MGEPQGNEVARLRHERDLLGDVLGRAIVASGLTFDVPMTGAELLAHGETLVEHLASNGR